MQDWSHPTQKLGDQSSSVPMVVALMQSVQFVKCATQFPNCTCIISQISDLNLIVTLFNPILTLA